MEMLFWGMLFLIFYTLLGYPVLIFIIGFITDYKPVKDNVKRSVDIVIPVHNGGGELEAKLNNCLSIQKALKSVNIYVVSDGSDDSTVDIAKKTDGVLCLEIPERVGKVSAQNQIMDQLTSEIVLFTDVGIIVEPEFVPAFLSWFGDKSVGVVTCRDELINDNGVKTAESVYLKYDMAVRGLLRRSGSLIGVTGGFYAVRRELLTEGWDPASAPDFYVALLAIKNGLNAIEDVNLKARYRSSSNNKSEYVRKVRTITRGMNTLFRNFRILNPFVYGWNSLKLISHKLLRWLFPFLCLALFFLNVFLVIFDYGSIYMYILLAQVMILCIIAVGYLLGGRIQVLSPLTSIVWLNIAILHSWYNTIVGKKYLVWKPTVRA